VGLAAPPRLTGAPPAPFQAPSSTLGACRACCTSRRSPTTTSPTSSPSSRRAIPRPPPLRYHPRELRARPVHGGAVTADPALPARRAQVGSEIKAMVISQDKDKGRFSLSTKSLEPEPGDMLKDQAAVFTQVRARARARRTAAGRATSRRRAPLRGGERCRPAGPAPPARRREWGGRRLDADPPPPPPRRPRPWRRATTSASRPRTRPARRCRSPPEALPPNLLFFSDGRAGSLLLANTPREEVRDTLFRSRSSSCINTAICNADAQ
jgi:hypothetical protein